MILTQPFDAQFLQIEVAAHQGAHGHNPLSLPTEAQHAAGNYKKGRAAIHGLRVAIEQPRGSYRSGRSQDGSRWSTRLAAHYGYFEGVKGADGDELDCFIGFYPQAEAVYIINQQVGGRFDEHKVMLCFPDQESAERAYRGSYDRGWTGLHSVVAASVSQFKWWLKNGDKRHPMLPEHLPHEGSETMMNTPIAWDASAQPVGMQTAVLLYQIRCHDAGAGLLLDAVTCEDILEDADEVLAMDAMVTPYAKVERKMDALYQVMQRASATIKPIAVKVTEPFKPKGVSSVNVAGFFELSDGQTVSVYLHNPDTTPQKLAPTDELISWKWLLNKKDITIVVAPERGEDLNVREVARRIMKLAEKNSPAFQRANGKRAERMQAIQGLKDEIAGLEVELADARKQLEVAKAEAEERKAEAEQWDSEKEADVLAEMLANAGDESVETVARKFIKKKMQGRIFKTKIGDCIVNSMSAGKLVDNSHRSGSFKLKAIPYIPEILRKGEPTEPEDLREQVSGTISGTSVTGFVFLIHTFKVGDVTLKAKIKLGIRSAVPSLVYSLTANSYTLDGARKEQAPQFACVRQPHEDGPTHAGSERGYRLILDDGTTFVNDSINLEILEAWGADGNPIDLEGEQPAGEQGVSDAEVMLAPEGSESNIESIDPQKPEPQPKPAADLEAIFTGLDGAGLLRKRAKEAADAHPLRDAIWNIQNQFTDILGRLEAAGRVTVNR